MSLFRFYFLEFTLFDLIDIILVAIILYNILLFMRGTRARSILLGLLVLAFLALLSHWFELRTLGWLIDKFATVWVIAFLIVFQPELRDLLVRMGQSPILRRFIPKEEAYSGISELLDAAFSLAREFKGSLIVIEREMSLKRFAETGRELEAKLSSELLQTIFTPHSPLHDGAVIVSRGRVIAAGVTLPLSSNPRYERFLGMRHRAAIGITEQTDAITIVVSEETGQVSLAIRGSLKRNLSKPTCENYLKVLLGGKSNARKPDSGSSANTAKI